jgi:hypothetical protein
MNSSQVSNMTIGVAKFDMSLINAFDFVYNIGYTFIVTIICSFGFFLNSFCLAVFFCKEFDANTYLYFKAKTLSEIILTGLGSIVAIVSCTTCHVSRSYFSQIYQWLGLGLLTTTAYPFIGFMEMMILNQRYCLLKAESVTGARRNERKKSLLYISLFLAISIVLSIPQAMSQTISVSGSNSSGEYRMSNNEFGKSALYFYLQAVCAFIIGVVLNIIHILLGLLLVVEFKKFIQKKRNLAKVAPANSIRHQKNTHDSMASKRVNMSSQQLSVTKKYSFLKPSSSSSFSSSTLATANSSNYNAEKNLTSMVITLSILFLTSHIIQFFSIAVSIYNTYKNTNSSFNVYFQLVAYLLTYFATSINFFIYLKFNREFCKQSKRLLKKVTFGLLFFND